MKSTYSRVVKTLSAHPWAIIDSTLETICGIVEARANGAPSATPDEIRAMVGARAASGMTMQGGGGVAVIPLVGVLANKMNMMTDMSGGTSLAQFRKQLKSAIEDQGVKAVVIAVDSPGGSVVGCDETWVAIANAAKVKPVVASVDATMASAALWVCSACTAIEATPSSDVGSLGVYLVHEDVSAANDAAGVKITYIASDISPYKTEGNPDEPMSADAHDFLKARINATAQKFIEQVAAGRGLTVDYVQSNFGGGRTMSAANAKKVKMIDRVATFEETLSRLVAQPSRRSQVAAIAGDSMVRGDGASPVAVDAATIDMSAGRTHKTGMGSRQDDTACQACGESCPCDEEMCPDDCPTCDLSCACRAAAPAAAGGAPPVEAGHTDVGRDAGGQFASQCECHTDCACMKGDNSMCHEKCMTCAAECACLARALASADAEVLGVL